MKKLLALLVAVTLVFALATVASAEDYPTKTINAICPWGAGGGTDACLRAFCEALGSQLGVTITVDNLTGASGVTGHDAIADADPDGYTIGMLTFELSGYKAQEMSDYTYENYELLCQINSDPAAVTVNAKWADDNGITDLAGFIEYCQEYPGTVQMGGSSSGSVWHIAGGYLEGAADIDIQMITYADGAASAVKAAAQGEINGVTVSLTEARNFIESGDLICLGVMNAERLAAFPEIPTCTEQGVEAYYETWRGLAMPLGCDEAIVAKLKEACAAAVEDPTFVDYMNSTGSLITWKDADAFTAFLAAQAEETPVIMEALDLI